ncbi:hypothetical protein VIBHAR_02716 [Vibrio campbellii ATCC BAA-1116]|uniref:Uncharacterized protein n=1 Tax=Vibrio campbellii (strain ATCC BAA-1116) TaxID=2902295 RepID=A7MU87_VIBC1|nr:hypothetical protein VIBHAR_02716 [Vibrio campbellii ATCC BAA-1116]
MHFRYRIHGIALICSSTMGIDTAFFNVEITTSPILIVTSWKS